MEAIKPPNMYSKLTPDNIHTWKAALRKLMKDTYGLDNYDETISDSDWLFAYTDYTPQEAVDCEVEAWEP